MIENDGGTQIFTMLTEVYKEDISHVHGMELIHPVRQLYYRDCSEKNAGERQMNQDNVNLAERLITQAKKAVELIKDEISDQLYDKLCSTITM